GAAQGCAFFMPKEPLAPGESGRDPNEKHEVIKDQIIEREVIENEIIEIHAVGVPERKRLGEAVEAAFLAKATMLGFPVLKPWGDSLPYDFGVDGGRRLWRVQVKCATSHRGTRCDARAAGSGELYTLDDIDFLAAYVIRRNLWYVVPADAFVPRATVHFNYGPHSLGMFEKYRETWCLMACAMRARGRNDIPKRCRCEEMPVRCVVCPKK
ncbi:MAG: group I intron-associated PD-(D/E)XK endonuclease, partial [Candidatus Sulfotelmatobacter sp.]